MARKVLPAAKCSQMSNPGSGTGSGGDRCTEATAAMVVETYNVGPLQGTQHTPEDTMYWFTRMLNKGSNVSALESVSWINNWLVKNTHLSLGHISRPSFAQIQSVIDQGHLGVGAFGVYENLRLVNGQNPYKWTDHGAVGHVLLIVGYDTSNQAVIVHDPLRADPSGMPADYSYKSMLAAEIESISPVVGVGTTLNPNVGLSSTLSSLGITITQSAPFTPPKITVHPLKALDPSTSGIEAACQRLDTLMHVSNPFDTASPSGIGALNPSSWSDWISQVMVNFWGDTVGILLRALCVGLAIYIFFKLASAWIQPKEQQVEGVAAQAAMAGAV